MTKPKELRREHGLFQGYNLAAQLTDVLIDKETIIESLNNHNELLAENVNDAQRELDTVKIEFKEQLEANGELQLEVLTLRNELETLKVAIEKAAKEREAEPVHVKRTLSASELLERQRDVYYSLSHGVAIDE